MYLFLMPLQQPAAASATPTTPGVDLYEQMKEIYDSIIAETDDDGRVIAEMFLSLPDEEDVCLHYITLCVSLRLYLDVFLTKLEEFLIIKA